MSTGALLVLTAAPAAADETGCVKGVDPETTIANITCQFNNNVENIKDQLDEIQGKGTKDEPKPKPKPEDGYTTGKDELPDKPKPKAKPPAPPAPAASRAPVPQSASTAPLPAAAAPDILPEPQVADAPAPQAVALPETHLVSPVSVISPGGTTATEALWTAGAAGAIAAVVMAQFSLLGARLRRDAAGR